jgi:hypothetical protein
MRPGWHWRISGVAPCWCFRGHHGSTEPPERKDPNKRPAQMHRSEEKSKWLGHPMARAKTQARQCSAGLRNSHGGAMFGGAP